jgi:N-acetyl-anhydromuramyl-L-alanine amidase AmpD
MKSFEIIQTSIDKDCYKICEINRKIDFLIFHHIQANSYEETIEALEYHGVSANYLIDKNGKIVQLII